MEAAIHEKLRDHLPALNGWELVWDYPFEKQGKHMTHVWREKGSGRYRTVMKGAVEGVLEHCDATPGERARIDELVKSRAAQGERLLGLALREDGANGDRAHDERGQRFVAVAVFNDPIRPSAAAAIADCQSAGIEIKMLTGDHPLTAHFVADRAGIRHSHDALYTGRELERMDAARRRRAYVEGAVFSRVLPEQKHELIEALRSAGRVVAMVGDGINDAPALRRADIGISMGASATDVARSAAQIVLLESDFSGIVSAMLEGRRILSNLKRSFSYLVSFHVPVILLALLPPMLGWPPLLLPIHIITLELVVHPVSAFTFENQAARSSPRSENLLGGQALFGALLSGTLVSTAALACYGGLLGVTAPEVARSTAFSAVLLGNIAFVFDDLLPALNRRFAITAGLLGACVAVIGTIPLPALHLAPMGTREALLALAAGGTGLAPLLLTRGGTRESL
jgi:Ca2+-transporting ATPase